MRCAICDGLNELHDGKLPRLCAHCDGTSFRSDIEFVFRLSPQGLQERNSVLAGFETDAWPDDIAAYKGKVDAVIVSSRTRGVQLA